MRQSTGWVGENMFQKREIVNAKAQKWERASVLRTREEADMADRSNLSSCPSPRQEP